MTKLSAKYENILDRVRVKFENRYVIMIIFCAYKLLLDLIYLFFVGNIHSFFGVYYSAPNIINGWLIVVIMSFAFAGFYRQNTPSSIMLIVFNMVYFLPMTTYCSFGGGSSSFLFWGILYWALLTALQLKTPVVVDKGSNKNNVGSSSLIMLIVITSIPVLYIWVRYTGCRLLIKFGEIYAVRAEAATYSMSMPLRYLFSISPVLIALLIVLSVDRKNYLALIYLLALLFIDFSIAGHKSTFLLPVLLLGGYVLYRKEAISLIMPAGIALELLSIAEAKWGSGLAVSLIFRRMGFVLPQLSEYYYRFFMRNNIDFFRQGVLGKMGFDTIYSQKLSNVIGNNFQTQIVNCNNGLMADVWGNLGLIGIVVMPIVLLLCLRFLDFAAFRVDQRMTVGIVAYFALSFANSQWSTVLLSHGFLFMCIVLLFFPKKGTEDTRV